MRRMLFLLARRAVLPALVGAGATIAWMMIEYLTGLQETRAGRVTGFIAIPIAAGATLWGIGRAATDIPRLGGRLALGALITTFASLLIAGWTWVYLTTINPEFTAREARRYESELLARGRDAGEAAAAAREYQTALDPSQQAVLSVMVAPIPGAMFALIAHGWLRRRRRSGEPTSSSRGA